MRILILLTILSLIIYSCSSSESRNKENTGFFNKLSASEDSSKQPENKTTNIDYKKKLFATKEFYPFERWRESFNNGLTQYTKQNCDKTKKVFDELIASLVDIGEKATEKQKKELFKTAIIKINKLNDEINGLIETGEREDLCELIDKITVACGLDPNKYAGGEGLASEWREW